LVASPAFGQVANSRQNLAAQVTSGIIDNTQGLVSPKIVRNTLLNILASVPTFGDNTPASQAGNNTFTGANAFTGPVTVNGALTATGAVSQSGVIINVKSPPYNAICDGVADDAGAINAALTAAPGNAAVMIPDATCRVASTITVPQGVNLIGTVFNPGNPPTGSTIKCDLAVSPCVTAGGNNGQARVEKLVISRAAGTPASTAIGLQIVDAYNAVLTDVMVKGAGICYQFLAHPSSGLGLGAFMTRTYSGSCLDAHIDNVSWPELRIGQSRFGMNGGGDYSANAFMRFEGGVGGTAGGPNTVDVENTQFNQGSNPVGHWLEFVNLNGAGVPSIDATDFKFQGLHVEGISGADVYSDASWNALNRLNIANSSFNDGSIPFFALNAATQVSVVQLNMNQIYGTLSLTGHAGSPISAFTQVGGYVGGAETLTGVVGSTATVSSVAFGNGLTVTGAWSSLSVGPDTYVNGNLTNTATGYANIFEPTVFSWSAPIQANTVGTQTVEYLNGVVPGNYVQQLILNNTASANTTARTQWATSGPGVYSVYALSQAAGSPTAQFFTGYGVTGPLDFFTSAATSNVTLHPNGVLALTVTPSLVIAAQPVQPPSSTVAALPSCAAGQAGAIAYVTDANAPTYNGALTGGSTTKALAMCNGSAWVAH
jgi:hypothetical protein